MSRAKILLRFSAIYAVIGIYIGSYIAGEGSYLFRPIHTHLLLVGWLSLFAYATFYALYAIPKKSKLATFHVWGSIIGSFGLTVGMYLHYLKPEWVPETFSLVFFIVGGSILMLSFIVFAVMTFVFGNKIVDKQ